MTLPTFLLLEMRLAFRQCSSSNSRYSFRAFSTTCSTRSRTGNQKAHPTKRARTTNETSAAVGKPVSKNEGKSQNEFDNTVEKFNSKELVPREKERRIAEPGRRVAVPVKVLPKADLTPNLRLSPQDRLHVEVLTRRAPPLPEKKAYRERLLIYHWGFGRENALAILKMSCIVGLCAVTFIIAPAHVAAGTPFWMTSLIFLAGFVPAIAVNYMTTPMVSRVFLRLPPSARESPKAAMDYARNVPSNAELDIRFLRPWALEGSIQAKMSEFEPTQNNWLRPLTFKWIDRHIKKGPILLRNPTKFFVAPKTASGKAARDTIPGLWDTVYKKLSGVESDAVSRWKR